MEPPFGAGAVWTGAPPRFSLKLIVIRQKTAMTMMVMRMMRTVMLMTMMTMMRWK